MMPGRPLALTLLSIEALGKRRGHARMPDLTGIFTMSLVL